MTFGVGNNSNIGRLAKNSIYMYMRMVVVMLVSLYTSRIILQNLGIEDFGIYNVVGSIVVMFNSLKFIFTSSTQRYINYELGKGNQNALNLVFNLSLKINLLIGVVFFILVEIVGLWFINTHINVPENRLFAAQFVFQVSVISAIFSLMMTSFEALIIAHEHMGFYAGLSVADVLLKLAIAFSLPLFPHDRLITYALLLLCASVVLGGIKWLYCRQHYEEVVFRNVWDQQYFREMTAFAGWNFFGNTAFALTNNGINMVLNVFGGPVVNAARGIAFQVNYALQQVQKNLSIVVEPFAIKTYAEGNMKKSFDVLYLTSKVYFLIQLLVVIILTFFTKEIIAWWLGEVPPYVISFLIFLLWYSLVRALHNPINTLFYSVGDMKFFQLFEGIFLSTPVIISYFLLKYGFPFYSAFLVQFIVEAINIICVSVIAKHVCELNLVRYVRSVFIPCMMSFLLYLAPFCYVFFYADAWLPKVVLMFCTAVMVLVTMYVIGFNQRERQIVRNMVRIVFRALK